MLTITNEPKLESTVFELKMDGKATKLQIVQLSVADQFELSKVQETFINDKDLSETMKASYLMFSRIKVAVKTMEGAMFFTESVQDMAEKLSSDAAFLLVGEINKLNPVVIKGDNVTDKKK